jgi:hypothetical protein
MFVLEIIVTRPIGDRRKTKRQCGRHQDISRWLSIYAKLGRHAVLYQESRSWQQLKTPARDSVVIFLLRKPLVAPLTSTEVVASAARRRFKAATRDDNKECSYRTLSLVILARPAVQQRLTRSAGPKKEGGLARMIQLGWRSSSSGLAGVSRMTKAGTKSVVWFHTPRQSSRLVAEVMVYCAAQ